MTRKENIEKWEKMPIDNLIRLYGYVWERYGALNITCKIDEAMETKIDAFEIFDIIIDRLRAKGYV